MKDAEPCDVIDRRRLLRRIAEFDDTIEHWRRQGVIADQKRRELEQAQRRFIEAYRFPANPDGV